jgi:protein-S-isoprenylcysteine O-methyltransferase Ste14
MKLRILQTAGFMVAWLVALFWSAGTVSWVRGWVYIATLLAALGSMALVIWRYNRVLFAARAKLRYKDTKSFDKVFISLYLPLAILQPIVAGFDAVRFHWSSMPPGTTYAGIVLFVLAWAAIAWVMAINRFAEQSVRIQTERGHTVITTGPYRFVRHPMYIGLNLWFLATALILGSLWALLVGGVITALVVWRTAMEDRTLRRELPGYEEFTTRTRYRLVPGVW